MSRYIIKKGIDLSAGEIDVILRAWDVPEFENLGLSEFADRFASSEFHLLIDEQHIILSLCRLNTGFRLRIKGVDWQPAEFVGLVSIVLQHGYATTLIEQILENVRERNLSVIGFCESPLRKFYDKAGIAYLPGKARFILEHSGEGWTVCADDDILLLHVNKEFISVLSALDEQHPAYFIP